MTLTRHPQNPILRPNEQNPWEQYATFNGTVIKNDDLYVLLYRAMGPEQLYKNKRLRLSVIGKAISEDGVHFSERKIFIQPEVKWELYGCEDPRVTKIDNRYYIFYTALSNYPPNHLSVRAAVAVSDDLITIKEKHLITPFNAKAMTLFPEKINGLYTVLLTVNPDKPPSCIAYAQFEQIETMWDMKFWNQWYENINDHIINLRRVNSDQVEIGAPPIKTNDGWLLVYSYIKHYLSANVKKQFRIEAILLDHTNPTQVIGRIEKPLLIPEAPYEARGQVEDIVFPEGALIEEDTLKVYYGGADSCCALATTSWSSLHKSFEMNTPTTLKCEKFPQNPLLEPIPEHEWESAGVCNTAAINLKGKTYLVYRAFTKNNVSNLGMAISYDGLFIDERLPNPIYPLRTEYEKPRREGMGGGAEDPRITQIGDTLYMCYTAYDGEIAELAFTSISVNDFLARNWEKWSMPKIISPPHIMDKDGALFPEKIKGKYTFFHRIEPNVVIDCVDDLNFNDNKFLKNEGIIYPRNDFWDGVKIGINSPPIKTDRGWLVFYHGISKVDGHYRIGALLLDLQDVTKIVGRTSYPILEPETTFEKEGVVNNVVFSCGHTVNGDDIYIYYGGADKVICGAKININALVDYCIKSNKKIYLE
jgi:predicted GH43/DUF377 family glycosyl hydrolase